MCESELSDWGPWLGLGAWNDENGNFGISPTVSWLDQGWQENEWWNRDWRADENEWGSWLDLAADREAMEIEVG